MNAVFEIKPGMLGDARCLASSVMSKLIGCQTHKFRVDGPGLNINIAGELPMRYLRDMVLCEVEKENRISYLWADKVTGSLFSPVTGKCLTSPAIKIVQEAAKSGRGAKKAGEVV